VSATSELISEALVQFVSMWCSQQSLAISDKVWFRLSQHIIALAIPDSFWSCRLGMELLWFIPTSHCDFYLISPISLTSHTIRSYSWLRCVPSSVLIFCIYLISYIFLWFKHSVYCLGGFGKNFVLIVYNKFPARKFQLMIILVSLLFLGHDVTLKLMIMPTIWTLKLYWKEG